jgi:hypothetical protein
MVFASFFCVSKAGDELGKEYRVSSKFKLHLQGGNEPVSGRRSSLSFPLFL